MVAKDKFSSSLYFQHIAEIAEKYRSAKEYDDALELLYKTWQKGGVIFSMGCGGSASTATHFAADLAKTTIIPKKKRFKAISLVDNIPLVSAWTNDAGWGSVFTGQLEEWLTKKDVLVGFSVHGGSGEGDAGPWSQNLVQAMKLAKERGAKIIGFAGFDGGAMKKMSDVAVVVPINSEVYGTAVVEAMHVVLTHCLIFDLKERIKNTN
jgi:phosphoheptose isomerase